MSSNRFDEAEEYSRCALAADTAIYGPKHPAVGRDSNNLALLLRASGQLGEAEKLLRETLINDQIIFGDKHSEVADGYSNLGLVLVDMGRDAEAVDAFRRGLAIDESLHGSSHLRVAIACLNLGFCIEESRRAWRSLPLEPARARHPDGKARSGPSRPRLDLEQSRAASSARRAAPVRPRRAPPRDDDRPKGLWPAASAARHPAQQPRAHLLAGRSPRSRRAALPRCDRRRPRGAWTIASGNRRGPLQLCRKLLRALDREKEADARHAEAAEIASRFLPADQQSTDPRLREIFEKWQSIKSIRDKAPDACDASIRL